jgi:ketopantoate reductase
MNGKKNGEVSKSIVIVGLGEIGSVFARGFLRSGYVVQPVTRSMDMQKVAQHTPDPELVVIAVGEAELHQQLKKIPEAWKDKLVLLQNELLPRDWLKYELDPTVISVWFEKKKGQDSKVIIASPVYGQHAEMLVDALASIDIAARVLGSKANLLHELVLKNLYILTTNISGLEVGGNVGDLWRKHKILANGVANDVIRLQGLLTGETLNHDELINGMESAINGDEEHMCMGRSAPVRLQRALVLARKNNLSLPMLERISNL